jgi:methylated-DNA-[protein]-cysteine S-methyltransferase
MHSAAPQADRVFTTISSPVGDLLLTSDGVALTGLYPATHRDIPAVDQLARDDAWFTGVKDQLQAFFKGKLFDFAVDLAPRGTEFQQAVWAQLRNIPLGVTRTYAELALAIGRPTAARAVGAAVGKNPISFIVPCHRVIGTTGALTGYAGGLPLKRWLLDHEAHLAPTWSAALPVDALLPR